tara:strand:+ start:5352 stop:6116 length:765 start_codon:yes stop_codon:yes gene_type:complete
MVNSIFISISLIFLMFIMSCTILPNEDSPELVVFSAISFSDVILSTQEPFQSKENVKLSFSFSGSQVLASQISNGAPADLFLSSGIAPVNYLLDKNLLFEDRIVDIASNKLVVAIPAGQPEVNIDDIQYLLNYNRIAIADPEYAPAGMYTKQALENLGLEESLEPKILKVTNVRAALNYLETKNVDAAILYETDAKSSNKVISLDLIPESSYDSINYPITIINSTNKLDLADKYIEYLLSSDFRDILISYGFNE